MRILLIENDLDSARRLAQLLEEDGHHVAVAISAEKAFADAPAFRPELAVSAFDLSGQVEGFSIRGIITTSLSLVPVIMVTDRLLERAILACKKVCPFTVYSKPVEYDQRSRLIARSGFTDASKECHYRPNQLWEVTSVSS
jgi:DNA-binding NtrC family response regulator